MRPGLPTWAKRWKVRPFPEHTWQGTMAACQDDNLCLHSCVHRLRKVVGYRGEKPRFPRGGRTGIAVKNVWNLLIITTRLLPHLVQTTFWEPFGHPDRNVPYKAWEASLNALHTHFCFPEKGGGPSQPESLHLAGHVQRFWPANPAQQHLPLPGRPAGLCWPTLHLWHCPGLPEHNQ